MQSLPSSLSTKSQISDNGHLDLDDDNTGDSLLVQGAALKKLARLRNSNLTTSWMRKRKYIKMTNIGMEHGNQRRHLGNGYLQATVTMKEQVKALASIPPRNHLQQGSIQGQWSH